MMLQLIGVNMRIKEGVLKLINNNGKTKADTAVENCEKNNVSSQALKL